MAAQRTRAVVSMRDPDESKETPARSRGRKCLDSEESTLGVASLCVYGENQ